MDNHDTRFAAEVVDKVRSGELRDIMVVATVPDGSSIIIGPGCQRQLDLLGAFAHASTAGLRELTGRNVRPDN